MELVGTMLVGPHEAGLRDALQSLRDCGCDAIYVLVDTLDDLSKQLLKEYECVIVSRAWTWDFGGARTALQQALPADVRWQIWLDTDDTLPPQTCEWIRSTVQGRPDTIFALPYVYVNEAGAESARLYRQRLFPPAGVVWRYRAHEVPVFPEHLSLVNVPDAPVIHHWRPNTDDRARHCIDALRRDLVDYPGDARVLHYLAQSLDEVGEFGEALMMYERYLASGGWDEERMKACLALSYLYQRQDDLDRALEYAKQADAEKPNRREPYQRIAEIYYAMQDWRAAYEWLVREIELPFPEHGTLCVLHDHYRERPYIWLAIPCDRLGLYEEGLRYARKVLEYDPGNQGALSNVEYFENCLSFSSVVNHPTIFFYVGYSSERWNATSINQTGIGGRETSNIHMAKELQRLGWNVVVFADCQGMDGEYDGVVYVDYPLFETWCARHKPDVVMTSGRTVILDNDFPARLKVYWIHDIGWGNSIDEWPDYLTDKRRERIDEFIFMSPFQQTELTKRYNLPPHKAYLSRSGIKIRERFGTAVERSRHRLIYTSSADRGLERLLAYWPAIKERVPDAELHVFYGFLNAISAAWSYSEAQGRSMEQWVQGLKTLMDTLPGVMYHDRVSQDRLAVEFQKSSVWAYPTHFWETMCLSALEACAAGCAVVTTDLGALTTTVGQYGTLIQGDPNSEEYRERFIDEVVRLLTDDVYWQERSQLARSNIYDRYNDYGTYYWDWRAIAQEWDAHLRAKLGLEVPLNALDDNAAYDYLSCTFHDYMQDRAEILWVMQSVRDFIQRPLDVIVEVGCGYGANLGMLSRLLSDDGVVVGIDPELGDTCYIQRDTLARLFPGDNLKLIHKRSQDTEAMVELSDVLAGRKIDLAFIDGSHTYEDAIVDWNNLLPYMSRHSMVVFHDIGGDEPCADAFDEARQGYRSVRFVNDIGTGIIYLDGTDDTKVEGAYVVSAGKPIPSGQYTDFDFYARQYIDGRITAYHALFQMGSTALTTPATLRSLAARSGQVVQSMHSCEGLITASFSTPDGISVDQIMQIGREVFGVSVVYPDDLVPPYYPPGEMFVSRTIDMPVMSVIIPACRQLHERTERCVRALLDDPIASRCEFIGVDDGSKDGTTEFFQQHVHKTIRLSPRQGVCAAVNAGISASSASVVCVVQNDVDMPVGLLQSLYDGLLSHPDWGMVVGWYDQWDPYVYDGVVSDGEYILLPCLLGKQSAWDVYVPGTVRAYRRDVLVRIGLYDPYLYNMWEDHDTALAIQSAGYKIAVAPMQHRCFDVPSSIQANSGYTQQEHIRRFLSVYYVHLKWGYGLDKQRLLSVEV